MGQDLDSLVQDCSNSIAYTLELLQPSRSPEVPFTETS